MSGIKCSSLPSSDLAYTNKVYVNEEIYRQIASRNPNQNVEQLYIRVKDFILGVNKHSQVTEGIAMSKFIREMAKISIVDNLPISVFNEDECQIIGSVDLKVEVLAQNAQMEIQEDELDQIFRDQIKRLILNISQALLIDLRGTPIKVTVMKIQLVDLQNQTEQSFGIMHEQTTLNFESANYAALNILSNQMKTTNIFDGPSFNFEALGIGGLDNEFSQIFRRAFASRLFPSQVMRNLGIKHVKGILLYGPPGNGKTLIARQLAKCLKAREPKIVNGPEVFDKYVGQTEQNVRELFREAEQEQELKGDQSQLHIIIFDELDAICKQRGSVSSGTGVHDTVVNQLLSKIDGVNALNNLLIIGMTNRKDLIDDAILRPGRLEVHVEIGLPDEHGREQILRIHTKSMRDSGYLDQSVDLLELANLTKNFSGAEIEALVKSAASHALNTQIDINDLGRQIQVQDIRIQKEHFMAALDEIQPSFGIDEADLQKYFVHGIYNFGQRFESLYSTLQTLINQVRENDRTPLLSVLLEGGSGTGKTALVAKLALENKFPYTKLISPENFVGYQESAKVLAISKIFEDAYRSPLSLVILDNIERLIDYVAIGPRFSNIILQALLVLSKKIPPNPKRRIVIIGTTSNAEFLEHLELINTFNVVLNMPQIEQPEEIEKIMNQYPINQKELQQIQQQVGAVPIKQLILAIEMALQKHEQIKSSTFLRCLRSIRK